MKGRVCVVTGATSGIGKVTALELARQGATVVLVARDEARGASTVEEIRKATGNPEVTVLRCDLSSQADLRRLAGELRAKHDRLHVLVNNAGAIFGDRRKTVDGIEATFATNHLAYFLLTNLLLDLLVKGAPSRVVSVASAAHRGSSLDFDDLQFERRSYGGMGVYSASKLANIVWSAELARRTAGKGVTANSLHPGVIASGFGGTTGPGWMRFGLKLVSPFLITPEKGARTTLFLATSPEVEGVSGKYFEGLRAVEPSRAAREADGARLWSISEGLTSQ